MKKEMAVKSNKVEFEKKTVGIVSVVTGDKVAKLTLVDGKKFKNGQESVKVNLSDLPKAPRLKPNNTTPIELRVRMNDDDTEVEEFGPVRGTHPGKVVGMGYKESEEADPMPKLIVKNKGESDEYSYLQFFVVYEITQGVFKGTHSAFYMHYKFAQSDEDDTLTGFNFNTESMKATRGQQLLNWGYVHEVWGEPIPWDDDTVLPTLLERVLESDLEVNLVFDKGYIQTVQPMEDYGAAFGDVDDAYPPVEEKPKKVIRKSKKTETVEDEL